MYEIIKQLEKQTIKRLSNEINEIGDIKEDNKK